MGVCYAKLRAIHAMPPSMVYVRMCQMHVSFLRANLPINMPLCQRCANCSTWGATVPKNCQFFSFACQKVCQLFIEIYFSIKYQFSNFSIMINICKFQENLGNSRTLFLRNKENKFWLFKISLRNLKPC